MTIHRAAAPLMAALLLVGALAGCTASISRTVSADAVAKTAAGALETEYSITVDGMDCGSDSITLREGEQVACTVTVDGADSDATVTLSNISGATYKVGVDVPQASWLQGTAPDPSETGSGSDSEGTGNDAGAPVIYGYELAKTAAGALESQYGSLPTVTCRDDKVTLTVGAEFLCDVVVSSTGARGIATVTITKVEGTTYGIDVKVVDA